MPTQTVKPVRQGGMTPLQGLADLPRHKANLISLYFLYQAIQTAACCLRCWAPNLMPLARGFYPITFSVCPENLCQNLMLFPLICSPLNWALGAFTYSKSTVLRLIHVLYHAGLKRLNVPSAS